MNIKESILNYNLFILNAEYNSFYESIRAGVELLYKQQLVDCQNYYDAIIKSYEELGPYFVICPGVAMPHARPEEGAKGTGFSLITLKTPIKIPKIEEPIAIILSLVAKDKDEHLGIGMNNVAELFSDEKNTEKLKSAKIKEDLEKIFSTLSL